MKRHHYKLFMKSHGYMEVENMNEADVVVYDRFLGQICFKRMIIINEEPEAEEILA